MPETKLPAIHTVPADLDPDLKRLLESLKEALEVRLGRQGDALDAAVTWRDLTDSGLAIPSYRTRTGFGNPTPTPTPSGQRAPTGLICRPAFTQIILAWDEHGMGPSYASTEIWRSDGVLLDNAIHIANTHPNIYTDNVEYNESWYYWIRFVSNSNPPEYSPFAGPTGPCTTAEDIGAVMTSLSEELSALPGYQTLINTSVPNLISTSTTKIIKSDTAPTTREDSSALQPQDIWIETDNNDQMYVRNVVNQPTNGTAVNTVWVAARDATLTTLVGATSFTGSTISAAMATAQSDVITVTNAQSSTATAVTNLTAVVDTKARTFIQTSAPTATATGDIWIDSDANNKMYRWNGSAWVAVAAAANTIFTQTSAPTANNTGDIWFDTDDSNRQYRWDGDSWELVRDVTTQAEIVQEATTRANADTANANSITALQASVGEVYGARVITTNASNNIKVETMVNTANTTTTATHGISAADVTAGVFISLKNTVATGGLTTQQINRTFKVTDFVNTTQLQVETVGTAATSAATSATVVDGVTIGTNAGLAQLATTTADIDGNAHAAYILQVNANGEVGGMVIEANASASGDDSGVAVQFSADKFAIWNGTPSGTNRTFDGSSASVVSVADDTITLSSADYNALYNTTAVTYSHGGGSAIGGLVNNTVYYVIKVASTTKIKLATTETLAAAGTGRVLSAVGSGTSHTVNNVTSAPFIVSNGNVYIDAVRIQDAQITGAKIADATIQTAHISDLNANLITTGTLNASTVIKVGSSGTGATDQRVQIDTGNGARIILVDST